MYIDMKTTAEQEKAERALISRLNRASKLIGEAAKELESATTPEELKDISVLLINAASRVEATLATHPQLSELPNRAQICEMLIELSLNLANAAEQIECPF